MLGKLTKYEYKATYKLYLILYAIVLVLAGLTRLIYAFDIEDNIVLNVLTGLFTASIVIGCIGLYFVALIFTLYRFYKNLFTDEGYLMFTLPVTPMKIIISKIIVGMTWVLLSILVIIGAGAILLVNTSALDMMQDIWALFGDNLFDYLFDGQVILFVMYLVNYAVGIFQTVCFIYLAVAFGQVMIPRHKVAGSILAYLIITIASSIISTLFTYLYYAITHTDMTVSIVPSSFYTLSTIFNLALAITSIAIVNNICKKHLNLA